MNSLNGKRVAILAADGYEQSELVEPMRALRENGADVDVISPSPGTIQGLNGMEKGGRTDVDTMVAEADPSDYDALVIPGGHFNPDTLRADEDALAFTRAMVASGKPVAAICHGPWVLADADVLDGRTLTSVPNIRRDIERAGARWRDEAVVVDNGLVTSRTPDDLPAFCARLVEEVGEGRHGSAA